MSEHRDGSGFYWDRLVTMSDGTTRVRPVSPETFGELVAEHLRIPGFWLAAKP